MPYRLDKENFQKAMTAVCAHSAYRRLDGFVDSQNPLQFPAVSRFVDLVYERLPPEVVSGLKLIKEVCS